MRAFWAIIAGLLMAAGVLLLRAEDGAPDVVASAKPRSTDTAPATVVTDREDRSDVPDMPEATEPEPANDEDTDADDRITATSWTITEGDTLAEIARRRYGDARLWRRIVDANPGLAEGTVKMGETIRLPDLEEIPAPTDAAALVADLDAGRNAREPREDAAPEPIPEIPDDAPTLELGLDREIPDATVSPGRLVRIDDGIVADDSFTIRGAGTREDPFRVSWELLASAADGYRPSLGERRIPQRVAALDGAWVRIDGYVAFPLGGSQSSELLVMLNQWDGCCIGIPPTPYDAIEATLVAPMAAGQRHAINYGSITGQLLVSPYLVEDWLVGLYLMDDAELRLEL